MYMGEEKVEKKADAGNGIWETIEDKFIEIFSSPKLAIFIFIVLAILSVFGTMIEQNREPRRCRDK